MEIDGPAEPAGVRGAAGAQFIDDVFKEVPPAVLQEPVVQLMQPTPTEPKRRQSSRLMARASSVPVSQRGTHRLIRQLGMAGAGQEVGDEAVEQYIKMYQRPLPRKTVAALQSVTRIANGAVMAAAAALAAEAGAVEVAEV
ncbi:unnamed protein product [Urochloa humidicola]